MRHLFACSADGARLQPGARLRLVCRGASQIAQLEHSAAGARAHRWTRRQAGAVAQRDGGAPWPAHPPLGGLPDAYIARGTGLLAVHQLVRRAHAHGRDKLAQLLVAQRDERRLARVAAVGGG
eukprot:5352301-Pleurochrysis_carterae.AAC.4